MNDSELAAASEADQGLGNLGRSRSAFVALTGGAAAGFLVTALYALQAENLSEYFSVATVGLMVASAALLVGAFLGFLFGIPRTLQQEGAVAADGEAGEGKDATAPRLTYGANTNLEQISDWLTKILVGVGLTQLNEIPGRLEGLSADIAKGMGGFPSGEAYALALLLFYSVDGFLFGFLWTRLFLAGEFRRADVALDALRGEVRGATQTAEKTEANLEEFKQQAEHDVAALSLVRLQLNPSPDLPAVAHEEINQAIGRASSATRAQIFNDAWGVRSDTWRDEEKKPKMEQTIPIFRALVESDPENRYDMNHGQLGFALKDQRQPDWAEAERELTSAIEIRGPWYEVGRWLFYEFNRALCRIKLDPHFAADQASEEPLRSGVLADLSAAWSAEDIRAVIEGEPDIRAWMGFNDVTLDGLQTLFEKTFTEHSDQEERRRDAEAG